MTGRRSPSACRSLALVLALAAGGTGLLAGPAHAAATTIKSPATATVTSNPTEAEDGNSSALDTAAPKSADPEDQNALDKAWAVIMDLITGDDQDQDEPEPVDQGAEDDSPAPAASSGGELSDRSQGATSGDGEQGSQDGNPFAAASPFAAPDDPIDVLAERLSSKG